MKRVIFGEIYIYMYYLVLGVLKLLVNIIGILWGLFLF